VTNSDQPTKDHPSKKFKKNEGDLAGAENPYQLPVKVINK
jgi:hypothetical protein